MQAFMSQFYYNAAEFFI